MSEEKKPKGPGIKALTLQQVFDEVARHLLTQRERSWGTHPEEGGETCMYRDHQGRKCAVGCLIPDNAYHPSLEGRGVQHASVRAALGGVLGHDRKISLLWRLQHVHDVIEPDEWQDRLDEIAAKFLLKPWPRETAQAEPKVGTILPFRRPRS